MNMEEKKGVSPLIATVLLIGLVVMIAMIIFFWYGNYLKDVLDKQGVSLETSCTSDVEIYISSDIGCSLSGENSVVTFYVENVGSVELRGLNVVYSSSSSAGAVLKSQIINQAVGTYMQVDLGQNLAGAVDLEIVPIIGSGSTSKHCENSAQYATVNC
tara:strand:- start:36 stop:509 length:474 start_codon:yes stop_codon:yes gene_type:complete